MGHHQTEGPTKWTRQKLQAILDVHSRYVVGWMIAERGSAQLATNRIEQTTAQQCIGRG